MSQPMVTVLMTCVNAQVAPGIMTLIRDHPDYRIRLIGCDAARREEILGRHFCHRCYSVPLGTENGYVEAIAGIVKDQGVQLIFPGSDEECLVLSENRMRFNGLGCKIACSAHETVCLCSDKYRLMRHLSERGVQSAAAYRPQSLSELENIARKLGYPEHDFVIKPRSGRGSRGFRVVSSDNEPNDVLPGCGSHKVSLGILKEFFKTRKDRLGDYLMMEWFPGDKYSADVLVGNGRIHALVMRNNGPVPKVNPPTQDARIVFDPQVRSYAEQIIDTLGIDYFAQVEIGKKQDGELGLIEVNTRMDATLPITEGLGLNFFSEMITYAMTGRMRDDINDYRTYPKDLRFRRYWQHLFEEIP